MSSLKKTGARQLTRHEVLIRKYDTDESSAVDDNSLVSILEDKKKFEMLEREAEVSF